MIVVELTWLEQAAQLCLVLGFCGTVFNYAVIRPLSISIQKLSDVVDDLREDWKRNSERLNRLEGTVAKIEQSVVIAHKRIYEFLRQEASHHETA